MKIRTEDDLFTILDHEIGWRRVDLTRLRKAIIGVQNTDELTYKTLLRTSVPLIYAHWEGFIKETATAYFKYVTIRRLKYNELANGFIAIYIQSKFLNDAPASPFEKALSIIEFFENKLNERCDISSIPEPIKTRSNLNSAVLREIMKLLELDYEEFRAFENFLDSKLLEARNKIAHGEYREIDWDFYNEVHTLVLNLIDRFKTQVENNVVLKRYTKIRA